MLTILFPNESQVIFVVLQHTLKHLFTCFQNSKNARLIIVYKNTNYHEIEV